MKVKFYGVRGSIPICDAGFNVYGGNTTCIRVESKNGEVLVIDAGTGIRNLGKEMVKPESGAKKVKLFFTHFHWDHIQGLPFFEPLYNKDFQIDIASMDESVGFETVRGLLEMQMGMAYYPVPMKDLGARINFKSAHDLSNSFEDLSFSMIKLNHPGGCSGLKVTDIDGKTAVIMTDNELTDEISNRYVDFCANVDLLVHDGQYTCEEYEQYKGWGHSSHAQIVKLAEMANAEQVVITHHDPDHDDNFLNETEPKIRQSNGVFHLARENEVIEI